MLTGPMKFSAKSLSALYTRALFSAPKYPITYHPQVHDALQAGRPVVALETAVVTHGLPSPINLDTALSCESIIRSTGAIPATIGMISGEIFVGLRRDQLERLADDSNATRVKLSRRDLGPAIAAKCDGGTTIAGTMLIAHLSGIKVFATGGLGGVHRGGENSMDVSADLTELGRTPVAVVSAGAKSILDLGRTLEYLETQGVTVGTYGESNDFPAFFSPKSGFKTPWIFKDSRNVAEMIYAADQLKLQSGSLIAVPIPPKYEEAGLAIQRAVDQAVRESEENGMNKSGKDATPWILRRVTELTKGESITNNVALIENTSLIGGRIAVEYANILANSEPPSSAKHYVTHSHAFETSPILSEHKPRLTASNKPVFEPAELVVVGATAVDITAHANPSTAGLISNSTVPGTVSISLGGVARNMAEAAHRSLSPLLPLSSPSSLPLPSPATLLVSPLGQDAFGTLIHEHTSSMGMRTDGFLHVDVRKSPVCNMVLSGNGNLVGGVADFTALSTFGSEEILKVLSRHRPRLVALDGNLGADVLVDLVNHCIDRGIPTWFEPTSIAKAASIIPAIQAQYAVNSDVASRAPITFASPNILELEHLFSQARGTKSSGALPLSSSPRWFGTVDSFELGSNFSDDLSRLGAPFLVHKGVAQMTIQLLPFFEHLIVKCGDQGVFVGMHILSSEAQASSWSLSTVRTSGRQIVVKPTNGSILVLKYFPAHTLTTSGFEHSNVVNVTGAGDSLVGSLLASVVSNNSDSLNPFFDPYRLDAAVDRAQKAAILTLQSPFAVSPLVSCA